jgi:coenzyme F420-reducing hydrogenase beta subunit
MTIKQVVENGFCVGCGGCKVANPDSVNINFVESGYYEAKIIDEEKLVNEVCPFSSVSNSETKLGQDLYGDSNNNFDRRIGFYQNIYAGNVIDDTQRINSSSGGITSWLTEKLLENNEVDVIVHVGTEGDLFQYRVSRCVSELRKKSNKKSRYYPVTFQEVMSELKESDERIAFVGIPCFIKSIRLLQKEGFLNNVKFCISLLCGHMKLSGFAESLAWQVGVKPTELENVDFRVKKENYPASSYFFEAQNIKGDVFTSKNSNLLGTNWGMGFFRHKACDFCDDIAGELADITLGDAWLPKYTKDYLGTNILVVRNKVIDQLLNKFTQEVSLENVDVDTFFETQAGNYRNRRGGILARKESTKGWIPEKRLDLCDEYKGNAKQNSIYRYRTKLSILSVKYFITAKKIDSLLFFKLVMFPRLVKYNYLLNGLKGALKTIKVFYPINIASAIKRKD